METPKNSTPLPQTPTNSGTAHRPHRRPRPPKTQIPGNNPKPTTTTHPRRRYQPTPPNQPRPAPHPHRMGHQPHLTHPPTPPSAPNQTPSTTPDTVHRPPPDQQPNHQPHQTPILSSLLGGDGPPLRHRLGPATPPTVPPCWTVWIGYWGLNGSAVSEFGSYVIAVHQGDEVDGDLLGAGRFAFPVVGAGAEEAFHGLHHAFGP